MHNFLNTIKEELQNVVPDGYAVGLGLSSPILKSRKTKAGVVKIITALLANLASWTSDCKVEINGNEITIYFIQHGGTHPAKVTGFISNSRLQP